MDKTKILVDASVLAMAEARTDARTGIYFLTRNLCDSLLLRDDVLLKFFILNGDPNLSKLLIETYRGTRFNDCLDGSSVRLGAEDVNLLMPFFPATPALYNISGARVFQIVHDLSFHACAELSHTTPERFREGIGFERNLLNSMDARGFAICDSINTQEDLIRITGYPVEKSDYFYPGLKREIADCLNSPEESREQVELLLKLPENAKYILVLSTVEPRKNIETSFKVFQQIAESARAHDLFFVIVGDLRHWNDAPRVLEPLSQEARDRIRITGYVPDHYLPELYSKALCLLYPSFYEGFGMPLVEAMAFGTPVVTSDRGSIPEVVGDQTKVFDAYDVNGMAEQIINWYANPDLRIQEGVKVRERSKYFTWERSVDRIVNFIKGKSIRT